MNRSFRPLIFGALLSAAIVAVVLVSGGVQLDFAVSNDHDDGEIEVRVQARQTESGRVEVRAQSIVGDGEWMTHTPQARYLPIDPEPRRWYSSSELTVSVASALPDVSDEAGYTRFYVTQAIEHYNAHGRAATIEYYNSAESAKDQWFLVMIDERDVVVVHLDADRLGQTNSEVTGPHGYPLGRMVAAVASVDGAWVDYPVSNPQAGSTQLKHAWVVRHDGLIFLSGWYEDEPSADHAPGAYTQSYVQRAIEMFDALGREATLEYYNSPESADDQWYMFIHQTDGTRVAHAYRGDGWLGTNLGESGIDVTGYDYGAEFLAIEESGWVSYVFVNPEDEDRYQRKHSWIVTHNGLQFGSGWYEADAYQAPEE